MIVVVAGCLTCSPRPEYFAATMWYQQTWHASLLPNRLCESGAIHVFALAESIGKASYFSQSQGVTKVGRLPRCQATEIWVPTLAPVQDDPVEALNSGLASFILPEILGGHDQAPVASPAGRNLELSHCSIVA